MATPTTYEPVYVSVTDVPIEVEDVYTDSDKREALFQAENRLEVDRNGGLQIEQEDITDTHINAILNLATYHLTRPATSNQDVTLGDLDDGGEQTERHAEQYLLTYEQLIDALAEAGSDGGSGNYFGANGDGQTMAVNNGDDGRRHDYRRPWNWETDI